MTGRGDSSPARVAVVGAGPVGMTAALLLAARGIECDLFDGNERSAPVGSKAICQQRDILDIWEHVGVGQRVADRGVTWTRSRTFYGTTQIGEWMFADDPDATFPAFVNISQAETEGLLEAQVAESPLIRMRRGHRLDDISPHEDHVALTFETPGGRVHREASYVILATGARSDELRARLGVPFSGVSFGDRFLICDIRVDLPGWEAERRYWFSPPWNPDRQVLIHPCPDSTFRIDWQVSEDFDLEAEERLGRIDERIRLIVGDAPYEVQWTSVYRFHALTVPAMRAGRVLLAGDVAHLIPPYGARGMNSGVQDAENAAWKLAYVLNGWAPPSLLDSYDAERLAATRENIDVTSATMAFTVPQSDDEWKRRRALLERAVADPAVGQSIESGRFAEPFWYVDSRLTTPNPRVPFPGRPPKGETPPPVPGVLAPDVRISPREGGDRVRLRQFLRDGVFALLGDGVPVSAARAVLEDADIGPVHAVAASSLDPSGRLSRRMGIGDSHIVVVRPDAHIAAIIDDGDLSALGEAARRAVGRLTRTTDADDARASVEILDAKRP